ncbi:MAG TPA: AraC family transcriptional regulator [Chitinophagaceae bacterium]|jgi:AraC-like DNA-binding protein|nr:AraC family transcriptional regulator [Chitinophagaceae bacterium]
MKPLIQKLPLSEQSSFVADRYLTPFFETPWHYHPEYELLMIIKGKGKRFIGNHVSDYNEGEIDFLGPNLPHWYRKEKPDAEGGSLVIHFKEDFLGKEFLQVPEMQKMLLLFEKSRMGLRIKGNTSLQVKQMMEEMLYLSGIERLICLLSILNVLSTSPDYETLSSSELVGQNDKENDRLQKVFDYVLEHFKDDISIEDVAKISTMSPSGFCRYFKNRTKKNFTHFVNEIRIGYACKQLMKDNFSISYVCQESGFNNMTNFIKQFKRITKQTPYQFRRKHQL